MKHKCQSSLVRCALRGQHPKPVVYPWIVAWLVVDPLRSNGPHRMTRRSDHDLPAVLDAVRGGYPDHHIQFVELDTPVREVPTHVHHP